MRTKTLAQIEAEFGDALSEENLNIGLMKRTNKDNEFNDNKYVEKLEKNSEYFLKLLDNPFS